jgi:poly(3-hydroxybutyrate) depolymerase
MQPDAPGAGHSLPKAPTINLRRSRAAKARKVCPAPEFYSVDHSIKMWIKANGCKDEPVSVNLPDKANDGTKVTSKTYGGGKDGAEVVLIVIEGAGHTWPGREPKVEAARQVHQERVGQRGDVEVLREAPDEAARLALSAVRIDHARRGNDWRETANLARP